MKNYIKILLTSSIILGVTALVSDSYCMEDNSINNRNIKNFDGCDEIKVTDLSNIRSLENVISDICEAGCLTEQTQYQLSQLIGIISQLTSNDLDHSVDIDNLKINNEKYKDLLQMDFFWCLTKPVHKVLDIMEKKCDQDLNFVKEYQSLLKYILYLRINNEIYFSKYYSITNAIQKILNSKGLKLIAGKLLSSIDKFNYNENALDTVASLIIEYMQRLFFKYHPNINETTKQIIKKDFSDRKNYIVLQLFSMSKLSELSTCNLKNYLDLQSIEIPVSNKEKYSMVENLIGTKKLNDIRLCTYAVIADILNMNEIFYETLKTLIAKQNLDNMKNSLNSFLTDISNELYAEIPEDFFIQLETIVWQKKIVPDIIDNVKEFPQKYVKYQKHSKLKKLYDQYQESTTPTKKTNAQRVFKTTLSRKCINDISLKEILYNEVLEYCIKHTVFKYIADNNDQNINIINKEEQSNINTLNHTEKKDNINEINNYNIINTNTSNNNIENSINNITNGNKDQVSINNYSNSNNNEITEKYQIDEQKPNSFLEEID